MQGQILPKIWPIKCHHFYIAKTNVNFATVRKYGSLSQCPPIIGDSVTSDIVALYHSLQCPLDIKECYWLIYIYPLFANPSCYSVN